MAQEITAEKRREYGQRWKDRNPEAAKESHRRAQLKWRAANREKVRERQREWAKANREKVNGYRRKQHYRTKYGLTEEGRNAMIAAQNFKCKTCAADSPGNKRGWVVDHCHASNKVRGILCHDCNLALGHVKDDVVILESLIKYLREN